MKSRGLAVFALMVLAIVPGGGAVARADSWGDDDSRYSEREEINQNYTLSAGASVEITDISGPVRVETSDGNTAEVHVVSSAPTREELAKRRVVVEQDGSALKIYTPPNRDHRWNNVHVRQSVTVRIPISSSLTVTDVAGSVNVGRIDGTLHVSDIAGRLDVESAGNSPHISDIAGPVTLRLSRLGPEGIRLSDIAGRLELRIAGNVDADVSVDDIAGSVTVDMPNVTLLGKKAHDSFHGRIGSGGPQIAVTDIAGSVTIRNE
jgi:DUF4097 and DUF4098 domain-containing protein YvlB